MATYFAVRHQDKNVVKHSRSGGVFTALSDYVLKHGGVVYGCMLDDNFMAVHGRAETEEQRNRFRGSKYVQSAMGDMFSKTKKDLEDGRLVLFSGTACQLIGLIKYLDSWRVSKTNLITLDVLCHGVPSPMVYSIYLENVSKKYHEPIREVIFRDKLKYGWGADVITVKTSNHEYSDTDYYDFFWGGLSERPSCRHCPFHKKDRIPFDITIGDFWGVEKYFNCFADDRGTSSVICNTEKGENIFKNISSKMTVLEADFEKIKQPVLLGNAQEPIDRNDFWKDVRKYNDFGILAKYRRRNRLKSRIKLKIKSIFVHLCKR